MHHLTTAQAITLAGWIERQPRNDRRMVSTLAAEAGKELDFPVTVANYAHVKGIVAGGRPNLDEHERRLRALERKVSRMEVEAARRVTCRCPSCELDRAVPVTLCGSWSATYGQDSGPVVAALARGEF